jgi:hypothetical protein
MPDDDAGNPLTEDEFAPTLVLHEHAERHFGWSTDNEWGGRLDQALEAILERGVTRRMYGPGGALQIVNRWLKVAYGMTVVLPVAAIEHSGTAVYLGDGAHFSDPGGWDSGWIGRLFATPQQLTTWGCEDPGQIEKSLRASFAEFAAWVNGQVMGYQIYDPDEMLVNDCYGIYDPDAFIEPTGWALLECHGIIDADIASRREVVDILARK